jgi:hypothetical protein
MGCLPGKRFEKSGLMIDEFRTAATTIGDFVWKD